MDLCITPVTFTSIPSGMAFYPCFLFPPLTGTFPFYLPEALTHVDCFTFPVRQKGLRIIVWSATPLVPSLPKADKVFSVNKPLLWRMPWEYFTVIPFALLTRAMRGFPRNVTVGVWWGPGGKAHEGVGPSHCSSLQFLTGMVLRTQL